MSSFLKVSGYRHGALWCAVVGLLLLAAGCQSRPPQQSYPTPVPVPEEVLEAERVNLLERDLQLLGNDPASVLLERAWEQFAEQPDNAYALAERALKISRDKVAAYLNYARMLELAGRVGEALEFARRALSYAGEADRRRRVQQGWIDRLQQ